MLHGLMARTTRHTFEMFVSNVRRVLWAMVSIVAGCGGTTASEPSAEPYVVPQAATVAEDSPIERVCGSAQRGPNCAADEYCDFELDAVCGADQRTGVCRPRPTECPSGGSPVCGCNDQTFPSACEANRFGVGVQGHGPCGPPI